MKKFILIDHEPWTLRRKQLFYDPLEKAGINLTVWDISDWLYPGIFITDGIKDANYLTKIKNEEHFLACLKIENPAKTVIIEEVNRNWDNRKIFKILSFYNYKTIKFCFYEHCHLNVTWKDKFKNLTIKKLYNVIKNKFSYCILDIYNKYYNIKKPDRIFSSNISKYCTDNINHPDYESYRFSQPKNIIDGKYIVFCDIFFPEHPDFLYVSKLKNLSNPIEYRAIMNKFFDYLESKYQLPVVIASHPKADYKGDEWGNRKIIKYETNNLVANASLVISHVSGSITFALLYKKPIVFVGTNDYFKVPNILYEMDSLAKRTLQLSYYNLDNVDFDSIEIKTINEDIRNKYIFSYLSSHETKDTPNWKTLKEQLSKM